MQRVDQAWVAARKVVIRETNALGPVCNMLRTNADLSAPMLMREMGAGNACNADYCAIRADRGNRP